MPDLHPVGDDHAADAHRSEQALVAGEAQDVDAERVHVDGEHAGALGGVDDEGRPRFARDGADRGQVLDRSEDVRSVVDDHHPGARTERIADRAGVDVALAVAPTRVTFTP